MENIRLNVELLRKRVPNLTTAAKSVGIRPATVSNLSTGKIDLGKAEVRTLVGLAELAKCKVDDLIIREGDMDMIETNIKALDFFAPLIKGGMTGIVARPGMGQVVIVAELLHRLKNSDYHTILWTPSANTKEVEEIEEFADAVTRSLEETKQALKSSNDMILFTDRSRLQSAELLDLRDWMEENAIRNVTTLMIDVSGEVMDDDMPYGPLDTIWQLDADLSARHLYPAVNPLISTSSLMEDTSVSEDHFTLRQRAQKVLRRYRELRSIVANHGMERIAESDLHTYKIGERLEAYFTQNFYVAEEFTKKAGQSVSLKETLKDVAALLDGKADNKPAKELQYIGAL
ncbi:hypothetical protein [Paenisporosarcina cavernae]|uniref:ATP synthase A/B type C-terminal domain-containing protein n=1 Tax=Paenisporosarcina cavernae TaxID=2320858 RepID=A0A385YUP1_9BACL|nr:hypothetical protein [Paenisporosarcina cavernae]AYC30274.1 hypothetical protein D3873_10585 [Paenisporosarcina cavernae]